MTQRTIVLLLLLLITATSLVAADGRYFVVVNDQNATTSLSAADLSLIFLKKKTRWADGKKIDLVSLPDAGAASIAFDNEILRRSPTAIRAYWQQEIFSGRSVPPVEKTSDEEVIAFILSNPGAIGYVTLAPSKSGVRVVKIGP